MAKPSLQKLYALMTVLLLFLPTTGAGARAAHAGRLVYNRWAAMTDRQLVRRGMDFLARQQPDSALVCYTIVTERLGAAPAKGKETELLIAAMYNTGYIYSTFYNDYPRSFSWLRRALALCEKSKSTSTLPYIYNSMAGMFLLNAELHGNGSTLGEVMSLFDKGFATAIANRDWDVAFVIFNNMVSAAVKYRRADMIGPQLRLLRNTDIPPSTPMLAFVRTTSRGAEAYRQGRYEAAAQLFAEAAGQAKSRWNYSAHYKTMAVLNRAYSLMRIGRHAEAVGLLAAIEREAESKGDREVLAEVRQMMRDCYQAMGDRPNAERCYVAYLKDRDSLLTSNRMEDVNRMRFLDEIDRMSRQVRDLTGKRRVQTAVLCGVAAVAAVVLVFLIILARKNRALSYRNRVLYRNNVAALAADAEQRSLITGYERRIAELQAASGRNAQAETADRDKYKNSTLAEDEKLRLAALIKTVMDSRTDEICSENFSLARLAELVGSNSRYVSQVLNEHYGRNFNAILSEYRIREACRRLNDSTRYGSLTIEGISRSVGFKSRSNFAVVFRRQAGLSPSEYQRMGKEAPKA